MFSFSSFLRVRSLPSRAVVGGVFAVNYFGNLVMDMHDMHDWRQYKRERYDSTVDVTVSVIRSNALEKVQVNAKTVDISQGGIGIVVDTPLETGFVRLNGTGDIKAGTVLWNRKLDNNRYRVGIRFDQLFLMNNFCQRQSPENN